MKTDHTPNKGDLIFCHLLQERQLFVTVCFPAHQAPSEKGSTLKGKNLPPRGSTLKGKNLPPSNSFFLE